MSDFQAQNILVIRFSSLGDVVLTTALLPNLKARWPDARVTVATKKAFAPVFDRNPNVDEVLVLDGKDPKASYFSLASRVKARRWDVVIDLHGNPRSWFLRLVAGGDWTAVVSKETMARYLLLVTKTPPPGLRKSVRERLLDTLRIVETPIVSGDTQLFPSSASSLLAAHGIAPDSVLIGIAPGAKHASKRWPAEKFAEAANRLAAIPKAVVLLLGDVSDETASLEVAARLNVRYVNLTGKTSLSDLIAVTSRLSFLLTNDSGIMHIGEALKVPLLALFGPTVRAFGFAPYRRTSRVAEVVNLNCRPCSLHGGARCPLLHHKCMEDIDVNAVLFAASELMESVNKGAA